MNSLKLGFTTLILASAMVSLTTAGTPNILVGSPRALQARPLVSSSVNTAQDLVHATPTPGSPRAKALAADLRRTSGFAMNCCSAVLAKTATVSPRAAEALPGLKNASPVSLKCSMGQQAAATTGCCAPAPARKAACCG